MKMKTFLIIGFIANIAFSARMIINDNGVENIKYLSDRDSIQFSEDCDFLYFIPDSGSIDTISLATVNRIRLDTLGGSIDDFIIKTGENEETIDFNDISRIYFILGDPDTITDTDGDGLTDYDERYRYGTNPKSANTDGDIYDDGVEINEFGTLWPLIAELPSFNVTLETYPIITFNYTYENSSTTATEIVRGSETSTSETEINMSETSSGYEHGWEASVKVGNEVGLTSFKADWEVTLSAHGNYSHSETHRTGTENSIEYSKNVERAESREKTEGVSVDGGILAVDFTLTNSGKFSFDISSLTFEIVTLDNGVMEKITDIQTSITEHNKLFIEVDDTSTVHGTLEMDMETAIRYRNQIANCDYMFGQVGTYNLRYNDEPLNEASTQTASNCATILIDFGTNSGIKPIERKVSALVNQNIHGDLDYSPLILNEALEAIKREYKGKTGLGPELWWEVSKIDGNYGLYAMGMDDKRVETDPEKNGYWYIIQNKKRTGLEDTIIVYNFRSNSVYMDTISIGFGDIIHIVFSKDADNDTLSDYEEKIYGSSDTLVDTDGDSLTDYEEIQGIIRVMNGDTTVYQTNPANKDSDGDGINDKDDPNPLRKPEDELATHSYLDTLCLINDDGDTVFYAHVDGKADTIDVDFSMPSINTDVSFITDSTAIMINALLNQGINLDVVQSEQTLKVWKSTMDMDRVLNNLQVIITSENGENRDTVILEIISPLPNVCEITDIEPNPDRPWEKIDITIDNSEQDNEDSRTDGVLLLRSTDSTGLYNFTPEDGNKDADVHEIGEINSSGIFIVSDSFDVSHSYTFTDDDNFDPGKKYYYRLIPYAYNNDTDKHPWYSKIVKMKGTKTKRVKCVFEFRQFKIIDEADGSGTCEIETKVCVNGDQKWSKRYEDLEDDDIRGSSSSPLYEGTYYLGRDEHILAEMELKEDDGDNDSDDYIFHGDGCGLNIFDYYQDDIGDAALGKKGWNKGSSSDPGEYYTRYHETKTNDATVEVWLYMFADIVD